MYVAGSGDKSHEHLVRLLETELKEKNDEIRRLRNEYAALQQKLAGIEAIFGIVKANLGGSRLTVNNYILHTFLFLSQKTLIKEFRCGVPNEDEMGMNNG
jgi:hypothetical protein